jgi:hypothetical protein
VRTAVSPRTIDNAVFVMLTAKLLVETETPSP